MEKLILDGSDDPYEVEAVMLPEGLVLKGNESILNMFGYLIDGHYGTVLITEYVVYDLPGGVINCGCL